MTAIDRTRRTPALLVAAVVVLAGVLATAAPARAQAVPAPKLTLEVQPAELTLDLSTSPRGRLFVVAHNAGGSLARADLNTLAPPGVRATIVRSPRLPSAGDVTWLLEVSASGGTVSPAKLAIELTYADAAGTERIAETSASVTLQAPLSAATALKATLLPPEGTLDEFTPFDAQLQLQNPTNRPIVVAQIARAAPQYVKIAGTVANATIEPGASAVIPLRLVVDANVPGTYTLIVSFAARYGDRPGAWQPALVQSKVTIGVPGVSEALQFLGIPSLLLLPGALAILTFITIVAYLLRRPAIEWKQPGLLVLAVTLSFVAAYLYPIVTGWFGAPRDYLRAYDLLDVVYLWSGSIAVGLLAAVAWWAIWNAWLWINRTFLEPAETDDPLQVLKKLAFRKSDLALPPVTKRPAAGDGGAQPTFLILPFGKAAAGQRWIVPRAFFRLPDRPDATQAQRDLARTRIQAVERRLEDLEAEKQGAFAALNAELAVGLQAGEIEMGWAGDETRGPRTVADTDYVSPQNTAAQLLIFRQV